jgi:hypothetical protein
VRAIDRWLFAPGSSHRLATVRTGLAIVIGMRIALGPYRQLAGQPDALFRPPPMLTWLPTMPPLAVIAAVQIAGVVAAVLVVARRRPEVAFVVAWVSLLFLAGCKDSLGKILHNDVLLLLAAVPLLGAPREARFGDETVSRRYGWPVQGAVVVIAVAYFAAGVEKLVHSGWAWVASDNMRWVLYQGAAGGRVKLSGVPLFLADRPGLAHAVAATILFTELAAPLILFSRRFRPVFVGLAVGLHIGTWLTLGLDYWGWALTVIVVLVDWDRVLARAREAPPGTVRAWTLRWITTSPTARGPAPSSSIPTPTTAGTGSTTS